MIKIIAAFLIVSFLVTAGLMILVDPTILKRDILMFLLKVTATSIVSASILGLIVFLF